DTDIMPGHADRRHHLTALDDQIQHASSSLLSAHRQERRLAFTQVNLCRACKPRTAPSSVDGPKNCAHALTAGTARMKHRLESSSASTKVESHMRDLNGLRDNVPFALMRVLQEAAGAENAEQDLWIVTRTLP